MKVTFYRGYVADYHHTAATPRDTSRDGKGGLSRAALLFLRLNAASGHPYVHYYGEVAGDQTAARLAFDLSQPQPVGRTRALEESSR